MNKFALLAAMAVFIATPAFANEADEAKESVKTPTATATPSPDKKAEKIVKRDHKKEELKKEEKK